MTSQYTNQNDLLLKNFKDYYANKDNMTKMISIINGQSPISLRIVDWFTTNYSKKYCCPNSLWALRKPSK